MRRYSWFLFSFFLTFSTTALSAPAISGGNGDVQDGGIYTITGTGFGVTQPTVLFYSRFSGDNVSDGDLVSPDAALVQQNPLTTEVAPGCTSGVSPQQYDARPRISTSFTRHANRVTTSARNRYRFDKSVATDASSPYDCSRSRIIANFDATDEVFTMGWHYMDINPESDADHNGYSNNTKFHDIDNPGDGRLDPYWFIANSRRDDTHQYGFGGAGSDGFGDYPALTLDHFCNSAQSAKCGTWPPVATDGFYLDELTQEDFDAKWTRLDTYLKFHTTGWPPTSEPPDGTVTHEAYVPGQGRLNVEDREGQWAWSNADTGATGMTQFKFIEYHAPRRFDSAACLAEPEGACLSDADWYTQEVYVANSRARVELCNASTWAAATLCEVQPVTDDLNGASSWSDTEITFEIQQGELTLGTAWAYMVDADGAKNASGHALSNVATDFPVVVFTQPTSDNGFYEGQRVPLAGTCIENGTTPCTTVVPYILDWPITLSEAVSIDGAGNWTAEYTIAGEYPHWLKAFGTDNDGETAESNVVAFDPDSTTGDMTSCDNGESAVALTLNSEQILVECRNE